MEWKNKLSKFIIEIYVQNTHRFLKPYYNRQNRPGESTIRVITNFRTKFILKCRGMSIRCRCQQLNLCYSTIWKILRVDLGSKVYKIQLLQELKPNGLPQHLTIIIMSDSLSLYPAGYN